MGMCRIAIVLCVGLLEVVLGGWNAPYTIYETDKEVYNHVVYTDTSTNKTHIVFTMWEDNRFYFYYMAISSDGNKTTPRRLTDVNPDMAATDCASITGNNDGKHIFLLLNGGRQLDFFCAETYFMESNSDGQLFSDPIIPRSDNLDDSSPRWRTTLIHTTANRLLLTYLKDGNLTYTARIPYSLVWSVERTLSLRPTMPPIWDSSTITYITEGKTDCITIAALYYDGAIPISSLVLFTTTTSGVVWDSREYPLYSEMLYLATSMAYSATTQRLLVSTLQMLGGHTAVLLQRKENETKVVAAFPISTNASFPSIRVCNIGGSSQLVYFVDSLKGDSSDRLLVKIPENNPVGFQRLLPPSIAASDSNIHIACENGKLVATGIVNNQKIMGAIYTFEASP